MYISDVTSSDGQKLTKMLLTNSSTIFFSWTTS